MSLFSKISALLIVGIMASFASQTKLTITSSSFTDNGNIPSKFTCEGTQTSPALNVTGVPAGAKSLALILHDPDAPMPGGFTHWVVWNIPTDGNISEDFKGAEQGLNGAKKPGYTGMCPPSGTHHYHFKVYALDTQLSLDKSTDKAGLEKAMTGHILGEGEIVGLYAKMKK
jgi:Raf kinase inhibitor-like YbhB/YbcL family protein